MKLAILFFALLGLSYALVPGMEYQYDYEGQVKVGMPEIRNRVAGAGIKCTINVQVQDQENVAFHLTDVKVGDTKEDVDCELRNPLKITYKDVDGHAKLLEDVYMIHPRRELGDVIETSKSEEVWISNIKRSIASLFIVVPIRNNFGVEESRESPHLLDVRSSGHSTVDEPSIFGHCSSDYAMIPLNNTQDPVGHHGHHGSGYPEQWTNYEMSRTINFDACNVSVNTKQASMGNGSTSHTTQFGDVQTRHSVMRHNLTFDGEYFILQNGTNEGHLAINPFGMNNEKLVSISNQTYRLKSVKQMGQKWDLPTSTRILDTWYAEVSSPFSPGPNSPDWVRFENKENARYEPLLEEQFWTGIDLTDDHQEKLKQNLDNSLSDAADIILREEKPAPEDQIGPFDSDSAVLASELELSLRAARALRDDKLKELFDKYHSDNSQKSQIKLRLHIDTMGGSGTGASYKVLLEKLKSGEINIRRGASVFFAMPNNLISTPVIEEIGDYVKTLDLDRDDPFSTSVIWINYAKTINKICVNRQRYKHTVPYQIFGKEHCNDKEAVDSILPFFEEKLKSSDESWKQVVLVHAIGNLGTSRAFSLLKSIVEDERLNSTVRVAAVYAIDHKNLDPSFKRYALRTFMSVSENRTDNIFVRQACIVAILSWKPPRSWYQTLASDSWRENSNEMSSFTYFILKSFAESSDPEISEQAQVARFFLPLTRPYAPSSRYSFARLLAIYDARRDIVTDFDVSSLRAGRYSESVPRQVFALLVNSFGGYRFSVAQSSVSYDARDMHSIVNKMSELVTEGWRNMVRSPANRRTQLALRDVQDRMKMQSNSPSLAHFYFSLFDDMELLLPLNRDSLSKAFGHDGSKLLKEMDYSSVNYTKFINLGLLTLAVPSELGLPIISRFSLPTFTGGPVSDPSLTCDGRKCSSMSQLVRSKDIRYDVNINYRFASKALSMIRILLPWNERTAASAVEALKGVSLPMKFSLNINREDFKNKNISVAIIPTAKSEITTAQAHTVPFVVTKNLFPIDSLKEMEYQVISAKGTGEGVEKVQTPINESYTGIIGKLRYEGDVSYPFTRGNAITLLRQPNLIPSLFTSPTCRMLEASLVVDFTKSATKEMHSSSSINFDDPGTTKPQGDLPNFKYKSTLLFNGTETRYYETRVEHSEVSSSGSRHKTSLKVSWTRSQLPRFDSNPAGYCLSTTRDGPKIKNIDDLRKSLQSSQNSDVQVDGELKGGSGAKACDEKHIATLSGSLKLSDERRDKLSKELESVCSYDPNDPTVTFVTAPVYDRLELDISYQEPVPRPLKNVTYQVYDFIRGLTFPHVYFNYMDQQNNPKDKISIRGDRYLSEKRWKVDAKMPTESSKLDNLKMPSIIENIVPVGGIEPSDQRFDTPKILFSSSSGECVLQRNKVQMFDGDSFDYTTDTCETVAVNDLRSEDRPVALVHTEKNELAFVVRFPKTETIVDIKPGSITVDKKMIRLSAQKADIKSSDGTVVASGLRGQDYVEISVPDLFSARFYDDSHITILPSDSVKTHYGGICGNYGGDKKMVGPEGCVYTDSQLFTDSWVRQEGSECSSSHYNEVHQRVEDYQKNCPKSDDNTVERTSVLSQYSKVAPDCIEYVYKIKRNDDGDLCVTQGVVAICYPLCKLDKSKFYNENYSCWKVPSAPADLVRNEKRGYMRYKIDQQPESTHSLKTEHAFICSRK